MNLEYILPPNLESMTEISFSFPPTDVQEIISLIHNNGILKTSQTKVVIIKRPSSLETYYQKSYNGTTKSILKKRDMIR